MIFLRSPFFRLVVILVWLLVTGSAKGQSSEQPPSRLIELTAFLGVTNSSDTPIQRYVYRLTEPVNDLPYQRSFLVRSEVPPNRWVRHKNNANRYVEFHFPVPARSRVEHEVTFLVWVMPFDMKLYSPTNEATISDEIRSQLTSPSKLIESDCIEVQAAARRLFATDGSAIAKARRAYQYPAQVLQYKLQKSNLGAQKALQTGIGDCTEFATLFAALCRTQKIPARKVAVFNLGNKLAKSVKRPNHHIAEVFLDRLGWMPVDPNLGRGHFDRAVGFGKLSNHFVVLNREGAWVWSTRLPKDGYDKERPKPKSATSISWAARVLQQGTAKQMYDRYAALKRNAR